ncbi:MAG: DUF2652 domain-containing protein [Chitinophagales bacterium]
MEIKKVFLALVDISGYTQFIKLHKVSLLHAEEIISDLLNEVLIHAKLPLVAHDLEGDAIFFYAESDGSSEMARAVYEQIQLFHEVFQAREQQLISNCSICICQACQEIGELKLKSILHHGEAAFSQVQQFKKLAGEDVILAHRLLKNSVPSKEYVMMSSAFHELCGDVAAAVSEDRCEECEGLGKVDVRVFYPEMPEVLSLLPKASLAKRLFTWINMNVLVLKRLWRKKERSLQNLESTLNS